MQTRAVGAAMAASWGSTSCAMSSSITPPSSLVVAVTRIREPTAVSTVLRASSGAPFLCAIVSMSFAVRTGTQTISDRDEDTTFRYHMRASFSSVDADHTSAWLVWYLRNRSTQNRYKHFGILYEFIGRLGSRDRGANSSSCWMAHERGATVLYSIRGSPTPTPTPPARETSARMWWCSHLRSLAAPTCVLAMV